MDVDDTDRRIINALLADGRADTQELSQATGLSVPVVDRRLESLQREGVVDDTEPAVDYDELGFDVTAVLQITATDSDHEAVVDLLEDARRLTTVYVVTGESDVLAIGKFQTVSALNERVGDLLTAESVRSVMTTVVSETVREGAQFPLDLDEE